MMPAAAHPLTSSATTGRSAEPMTVGRRTAATMAADGVDVRLFEDVARTIAAMTAPPGERARRRGCGGLLWAGRPRRDVIR